MFLRVTIEIHLVSPDTQSNEDNLSVSPEAFARSRFLKLAINADLERFGGFQIGKESPIAAENMLNDPESVLESIDGEHLYLLEGYFDSDFFHVYIDWEVGNQPRILKNEREKLRRRVKLLALTELIVRDFESLAV